MIPRLGGILPRVGAAWHTRCMRYQVEFQGACPCCRRAVDVLSARQQGERRNQAGLLVSRHLRPRRVGESRGMCEGSMRELERGGAPGTGVASISGAMGSGVGKNRARVR